MKLLLLVTLLLPLQAQTLTQIVDTLYNPDGSRFKGIIEVGPSNKECALTVGNESYAFTAKTYCIGVTGSACDARTEPGVIDISLVPNQGAEPANCHYLARVTPQNKSTYTLYWLVPATGPVNLKAVRIPSAMPNPYSRFLWTQIDWSGFVCASVPALCGLVGGQHWTELTQSWGGITAKWSEL